MADGVPGPPVGRAVGADLRILSRPTVIGEPMEPTRSGFATAVLLGRVPSGFVDPRAWAHTVGKRVGWCWCGQHTTAGEPITNPDNRLALVWYPARCTDGHVRMASGARTR